LRRERNKVEGENNDFPDVIREKRGFGGGDKRLSSKKVKVRTLGKDGPPEARKGPRKRKAGAAFKLTKALAGKHGTATKERRQEEKVLNWVEKFI